MVKKKNDSLIKKLAQLNPKQLEILLDEIKNPTKGENKKHHREMTGEEVRYGVYGDRHVGSKYFDYDALMRYADEANKWGVHFMLDCGDSVDGSFNMHRGMWREQSHLGFDDQLEELIRTTPDLGVPLYHINGNHDYSWLKTEGVNLGIHYAKNLKNVIHLGTSNAVLQVGKTKIQMLHPGGGSAYALCFDKDTEILTENGWKLFKYLRKDEFVATLNIDSDLFEWQKPTSYTEENYEGDLFLFEERCFSLLVTPNHRMLVRRYNTAIDYNRLKKLKYPTKSRPVLSKEWTVKTAQELANSKRQQWQMKRGGQSWKGTLISGIKIPERARKRFSSTPIKHLGILKIEDVAELVAWYVTEGHIDKKKKQLNICQSIRVNPENHGKIINLFQRISLVPKVRGRDLKDIVVCSVELCEWLVNECGTGSANKFLPKWLKEQPSDILNIVFETMVEGDGWTNGKGFGYKSISKRLRQDFTEISHKLGFGTTEYKDSVSVTKVQIYPTINSKPNKIKYSGKVYCVSVPNKFILVRRNGRSIWSGNSYKPQKIVESFEGGTKPEILHINHYHKMSQMFYRNVHIFQDGTFQSQTPFMMEKGLAAHKGSWLVMYHPDEKGGIVNIETKFIPFYE